VYNIHIADGLSAFYERTEMSILSLFSKTEKENPNIEDIYHIKYSNFLNDVYCRSPLMEKEYRKLINIMAYKASIIG
jgi:hypothetical protein